MGTGWRKAFCTSIRRDPPEREKQSSSPSPSPRSCTSLFSSASSNPSTPRVQSKPVSSPMLRCRTTPPSAAAALAHDSPRLVCKTKSPRPLLGSNPSSPKSPSRFSLFKTSLRLSRSSCGICSQSVKTGQGMAIFTAECSHAFHFPCIATHVRKAGSLVCPVCSARWQEVPLLAVHKGHETEALEEKQIPTPEKTDISAGVVRSRAYDDDEPLTSPPGARFNPIPEEDDEEIGEFQGFFVSPSKPSRSHACAMNGADLKRVEAGLMPEAAVVSAGRNHESYAVVLRVKAPPTGHISSSSQQQRAPVDLVTVLDVSESMTGAKLHMLKRAMRLVISSLGPADRLSIVAFSSHAKRLTPLSRMSPGGQRAARRAVDRLACAKGGTCVGDALRKAAKVLEDRRERNPVASIMLLSDGQDDRTPSDVSNRHRPARHVPSTRFAHVEIPVHASGFGSAHQPPEDAFTKCVGGLLSVIVQDVRLQLGFVSGSAPVEISAVYSCGNGRPAYVGSNSVRIGDLYAEEERELLVELRVPASVAGAHHVLSVRCTYRDPGTQELVQCKDQALLVPRPHAFRSSAPKIERLRNLFIATKAISEARRQADHNDLAAAQHMLSSARELLLLQQQQSGSVSAEENVLALEAELAELRHRRLQMQCHIRHHQIQRRESSDQMVDESGEPLTPTSAWRAAEKLAKVAIMRKSLNRVSDLHGFENARF